MERERQQNEQSRQRLGGAEAAKAGKIVFTYGPADFFGELALLEGRDVRGGETHTHTHCSTLSPLPLCPLSAQALLHSHFFSSFLSSPSLLMR